VIYDKDKRVAKQGRIGTIKCAHVFWIDIRNRVNGLIGLDIPYAMEDAHVP